MILRFGSDLPLEADPSNRFLPGIVGVLAFLVAVALALAISLDRLPTPGETAGETAGGTVADGAARLVQWASVSLLAVLAGALFLVVMFAAQTSLRIHRPVIELLHLMGARNRYIARQFARQTFWLGLFGGTGGAVAGAAVTWAGAYFVAGQASLPQPWQAALVLAVPAMAAAVAAGTAWLTVLRGLARMA